MSEDYDDDLGLDDLDLGELGLDEFNDMADAPDDKRGAVSKSLRDVTAGFGEEFTDNKVEALTDVLHKSIPESLSSETALVTDAYTTVKDEINEAGKSVRREARSTLNTIKRFLPTENATINKFMGKAEDFLSDGDNSRKVDSEAERLVNDVNSVMGAATDGKVIEELINRQIETNRAKTQQELLGGILANTERSRKFSLEIANNYYRRSIELQFRNLYAVKELSAINKEAFNTFKNQFESIVKNTALPDFVKVRGTEALKAAAYQNIGGRMTDTLFGSAGPLGNFNTNLKTMVNDKKEQLLGVMGGINNAGELAEASSSAGITTGGMLGSLGGGYVKDALGKFLGRKFAKSDRGAELVVDAKDSMNDLNATFNERAANSGEGLAGKAFDILAELTRRDKESTYSVDKDDPDASGFLTNRTLNSIEIVIPGMLGKMLAELQGIRMGSTGSVADKVETYDYDTGSFLNKQQITSNIKTNLTKQLTAGAGRFADELVNKIVSVGEMDIDNHEMVVLRGAILAYGINPRSRLNFKSFIGGGLAKLLPSELATKFKVATKIIHRKNVKDPSIMDDFMQTLRNLVTTLPNMKTQLKELEKSGLGNISDELGLITTDEVTGVRTLNKEGLAKYTLNTAKDLDSESLARSTARAKSAEEDKQKDDKSKRPDLGIWEKIKSNLFAKGGWTGDGGIDIPAGIVHGKEFVLNNDKVNDLISAIKKTDRESLLRQSQELLEEIHDSTKDISLKASIKKATSSAGYKELTKVKSLADAKKLGEDGLSSARGLASDKLDKLKGTEGYKQLQDALDADAKYYNDLGNKVKERVTVGVDRLVGSIETTLNDNRDNLTIESLRSRLEQSKQTLDENQYVKDIRSKVGEIGADIGGGKAPNMWRHHKLGIAKDNNDVRRVSNQVKDGANDAMSTIKDFVTRTYDDITDEDKRKLKIEFYTSEEYLTGLEDNFSRWLKTIHNVTPDPVTDKLTSAFQYVESSIGVDLNAKERYKKFKDSLTHSVLKEDELASELSFEDEQAMRRQFFKSEEYQAGYMTNFDEWLRTYGYRRNGKSVGGRLTNKLSIPNILKKTRALDKKIAKGVLKLGWGGLKLGGRAISAGPKALIRGGSRLFGSKPDTEQPQSSDGIDMRTGMPSMGGIGGGLVGGATKLGVGVGKTILGGAGKGLFYAADGVMSLVPGYNQLKNVKETLADRRASKIVKAGPNAEVSKSATIGDLLSYFKNKEKREDKEEYIEERNLKAKEKREASKERFLNRFKPDEDKLISPKDRKSVFMSIKDKVRGLVNPFTLTVAGVTAMAALGVTMENVKEGLGVVKNTFNGVSDTLGGIYNVLSGWGRTILNLPTSLSISIREALSTLPFLSNLKPTEDEIARNNARVNGTYDQLYKPLDELAQSTDDSGYFAGQALAGAGALYATKKLGGFKAAKYIAGKSMGGAGKSVPKVTGSKIPVGKVKGGMNVLRAKILRKLGPVAGAKLLGKVAARLVPVVGVAWLAYDSVNIARYMYDGDSFKVAASKAVLGFDIYDDTVAPVDEYGRPIKPAIPEVVGYKGGSLGVDNYNTNNRTLESLSIPTMKSTFSNNRAFDPTFITNPSDKYFKPKPGVNIKDLHPAVLHSARAMSEEYFKLTGKYVIVNSGYRSSAKQRSLKLMYGDRAASVGGSTHEYGLSFDINTAIANDLEKLGLMRKYGFTRPVGGEPWHIEPIGIQTDIARAKRSPMDVTSMVRSGYGKGGGGYALNKSAKSYSRDASLGSLPNTIIAKTNTQAYQNTQPTQTTSGGYTSTPAIMQPVDPTETIMQVGGETNKHLINVSKASVESLTVQNQILNVLGDISGKLSNRELPSTEIKKETKEQKEKLINGRVQSYPNPVVSLARNQYK